MSAVAHVFVYGTLRAGECNDINRLRPAPKYLGSARIPGALYDLGAYPGVRLGGEGWVQGDVYTLPAGLEPVLDEIEGLLPTPTGEYHKRWVRVELEGGPVDCLVYELASACATGRDLLAGGDWLHR